MYKSFVEETLMRLKEVTIKYPSAFLQGLGFNMNDITKKEMDNEWRKINGIIILEMADLYAFCQGNTVQNPIPCARPLALLSNIRDFGLTVYGIQNKYPLLSYSLYFQKLLNK
jgi:hypothetical protein